MNASALEVIAELYPKHGVELWRHVQWSDVTGCWADCQGPNDLNPNDDSEYRVKPNTHIVNGIECPAPMSELPGEGEAYYTLRSDYLDGIVRCKNNHKETTNKHMRFGIWLTYEDAASNRDAHYPGAFE